MSERAGSLPLVGGALCLDFCNTVSGVGTDEKVEHLESLEDLAAWGVHAGLLSGTEAGRLAARRPARERSEAVKSALEARLVLHELFGRASKGAPLKLSALAALNGMLRVSGTEAAIVPVNGRFDWSYADPRGSLASVLNPILRSAADVLVNCDLRRLKTCPGRGCGWLFYDDTKNANRVWCEMRVCGSRAKSRERYQRQKSSSAAAQEKAAAPRTAAIRQ